MTENLITAIVLIVGLAGLAGLVRFARRDVFAGVSLRSHQHDELGYRDSPLIDRPA